MSQAVFDDYFQLFSLPAQFSQDLSLLKARYYQLQQTVHPDNFIHAQPFEKQQSQLYAAKINEAYRILKDPYQRALYLLKRQGIDLLRETNTNLPMDVLETQMELREEFAAIQQHSTPADRMAFKAKIQQAIAECEKQLDPCLEKSDLQALKTLLWQMQFYLKLRGTLE